jgi:hypothetical protein
MAARRRREMDGTAGSGYRGKEKQQFSTMVGSFRILFF